MSEMHGFSQRVIPTSSEEGILQLDEQLASREQVFRSPPFTRELVTAIKLIAPHLAFSTDEKCRAAWERDQNGCCWGEYDALVPLFRVLPRPRKILEIGPGLGRSVVFFSKKLGWENSEIHLYEGDGNSTKYMLLGPRFADSFCGNISMLSSVLAYNGIHNATIYNAKEWQMRSLPGPYDVVYSFYSVGFHWSLEHFLDDCLALMHDTSVGIFTVPRGFASFPALEKLSHHVVDWKAVWPKEQWHRLLILSKGGLPKVSHSTGVIDGLPPAG